MNDMSDLEKYKLLCDNEKLPIFMQYWWLDVVCGAANWQPILAEDNGGVIQAAMVIHNVKKYALKFNIPPVYTPFTGIWMRTPHQMLKPFSLAERELSLSNKLIDQLPKTVLSVFQFHFSFQNFLAFYWNGFRQKTRFTYYIPSNLTNFQDNFKGSIRTDIKKAQNIVTISISSDANFFYEEVLKYLKSKGIKAPLTIAQFETLYHITQAKSQSLLYVAKDEKGNIHASIFVVFDEKTTYLLMTNINKAFANSGAMSYLIANAVKEAQARNQAFDFEGSMLPKIEPFFRAFGGERKAYYRIYKTQNRFWEAIFTLIGKI